MGAWLRPYGEQRRGLPAYSGPEWERVLDRLADLEESARDTGDPAFETAASDLHNNWSSLTGTKLQPNPRTLFMSGPVEFDKLLAFAKRRACPCQREEVVFPRTMKRRPALMQRSWLRT
jgi:hypothetical protein